MNSDICNKTMNRSIRVASVWITIGSDIIRFNTRGMATALYAQDPQDSDSSEASLGLDGEVILDRNSMGITPDTTDTPTALVTLAVIATEQLTVKLRMRINGHVNLSTALGAAYFNGLDLVEVLDATGNELEETSTTFVTLKALIESAIPLGHQVEAW